MCQWVGKEPSKETKASENMAEECVRPIDDEHELEKRQVDVAHETALRRLGVIEVLGEHVCAVAHPQAARHVRGKDDGAKGVVHCRPEQLRCRHVVPSRR